MILISNYIHNFLIKTIFLSKILAHLEQYRLFLFDFPETVHQLYKRTSH